MKSRMAFLAMTAFATAIFAYGVKEKISNRYTTNGNFPSKIKMAVGCSPDWSVLNEWMEEVDIPPIKGAGSYKWKISTTSDSAQFYFNQGINMYYSFHIIESMASFKKAEKFDPNSPMIIWAQALAYGPNINDLGYSASPDALNTSRKAMDLSSRATEKEKMLIAAQFARYSEDSANTREKLNQDYVDKMKAAYLKFGADADVAALYADALMLQHPWDLWSIDGTPKKWTPVIREILEKLLAKSPNHPGANHYYIHVMEASPYFEKAIPSADRLGNLTPALSHTVHMPSHIYLRSGHYKKGISVNESAVSSYKSLIPVYEAVTGNAFLYIIHNLHMQANNAMMTGQSAYSAQTARETANSIPADYLQLPGALGNYLHYINSTPILTDVRFGNWSQLLQYPQPGKEYVYGNIFYHFGRGMALANQFRLAESKHELEQIRELMKDTVLQLPFTPFSPHIKGATVAEQLLAGTITLKERNFDASIDHFKTAVEIEENMVYSEPRDWMLNPKHYLGDAYLKAGRPKEAIVVLEKDLKGNKENGWALFGIWQGLNAQKKKTEADKVLVRFSKAFDKADVRLYGPVF